MTVDVRGDVNDTVDHRDSFTPDLMPLGMEGGVSLFIGGLEIVARDDQIQFLGRYINGYLFEVRRLLEMPAESPHFRNPMRQGPSGGQP
ncbi:MAG: hypothetical protein ACYDAY_11945 [Candidatus Dormibacteria bacterium]